MKKILITPFFLFSSSLYATPYLEYQYGIVTTNHDYSAFFPADNLSIAPKEETRGRGVVIGFKGNDGFSVELNYKQFDSDNALTTELGVLPHTFPGNTVTDASQTRNWNTKLNAEQISLSSMYFSKLSDSVSLKAGLGLSLARYTHRFASTDTFIAQDSVLHSGLEEVVIRGGTGEETDNAIGVISSVQLNYNIWGHINIGALAQFQIDHVLNSRQLMLSLSYQL